MVNLEKDINVRLTKYEAITVLHALAMERESTLEDIKDGSFDNTQDIEDAREYARKIAGIILRLDPEAVL